MQLLKSVVSVLTASLMCCAFSGGTYIEATESEIDISSKLSPRLMEEYGVNEEILKTFEGINQAKENPEKVPVLVWCTKDVNHDAIERKALPALTEGLKSSLPFSSVEDVFNSGEELSAEAVNKFIGAERAESRAMYKELNGQFVEKYMPDADIAYISQYSPVILAELTFAETAELAKFSATLEFDYCGKEDENKAELDKSIPSINADDVWTFNGNTGYTGNGVKIGQIDIGIPNNQENRFSHTTIHLSNTTNVDGHATWVASILIAKEGNGYYQGVAPDAELYSTTYHHYTQTDVNIQGDLPAVEWLLSENVNVINASMSFGSNPYNTYGSCAKWLDHIAKDHHVTFVKSAGNVGTTGISSGGMAYNIITVGNVNDKNTPSVGDDELLTETLPSSYYNDANTHLAYKPDLCAPGTNIRVSSNESNGGTGTSASAPHVTGTVALLMEAVPDLKLRPEVIKAILAASVNPSSTKKYCPSSWTSNNSVDSYAKYGAGLLDAYSAVATANSGHYYFSSLNPNKNEEELTMNITSANAHVRVSLAYIKNNYWYPSGEHTYVGGVYYTDLPDLDLYIYDPNGVEVGHSYVTDNNVEIVDFTSAQAGTYKIKVKKYGSSLTETVNYGVSWLEVS